MEDPRSTEFYWYNFSHIYAQNHFVMYVQETAPSRFLWAFIVNRQNSRRLAKQIMAPAAAVSRKAIDTHRQPFPLQSLCLFSPKPQSRSSSVTFLVIESPRELPIFFSICWQACGAPGNLSHADGDVKRYSHF